MDDLIKDKKAVRKQINILKTKGIIKYDSDLARDLGYSKGAISELLSLKTQKPITNFFLNKFKTFYKLEDQPQPSELDRLKAEIKVLKQSYITLISKSSKKDPSLIAAEMEEAVRLLLNG